jgi:phage gp37-like protein
MNDNSQLNIPYGEIKAIEFINEYGRIMSIVNGIKYEFQEFDLDSAWTWLGVVVNGEIAMFFEKKNLQLVLDRLQDTGEKYQEIAQVLNPMQRRAGLAKSKAISPPAAEAIPKSTPKSIATLPF